MGLRRFLRPLAMGGLLLLGGGAATAQRHPGVAALNGFEAGQWQLRGSDGAVRRLCVRNPAMLLQILHGDAQCEHFVMDNGPRSATIRYTCPSHGHGRTTITLETPRVISLETQGVSDGAPFSELFEGRRIGACN